jgi:hypothetical protein
MWPALGNPWSSSSSSFPIEDLEAVHVGSLVLDGSHGVSPLSRSVTALDASKGLSRGWSNLSRERSKEEFRFWAALPVPRMATMGAKQP